MNYNNKTFVIVVVSQKGIFFKIKNESNKYLIISLKKGNHTCTLS